LRKTRLFTVAIIFVLIISIIVAGCAADQRQGARNTERYGTRFNYGNNNGWYNNARDFYGDDNIGENGLYGYDGASNYANRLRDNYGDRDMALNIQNSIRGINNVDDAVVILNDTTCYVAVDTDDTRIDNKSALERQIADRIRSLYPEINRIYVTTDDQGLERLRNFARDITGGRPVRDFLDEIEDIFR